MIWILAGLAGGAAASPRPCASHDRGRGTEPARSGLARRAAVAAAAQGRDPSLGGGDGFILATMRVSGCQEGSGSAAVSSLSATTAQGSTPWRGFALRHAQVFRSVTSSR